MAEIFSHVTAMRLFKEESFDLALCSAGSIQAAADEFERQGDYAAASDIVARWDDYQEELRCMMEGF